MNIGFFVHRETHLKILGSLIELCSDMGHQVFLFRPPLEEGHGKSDQQIDPEILSQFDQKGVTSILSSKRELAALANQAQIHALVVLEGYHVFQEALDTLVDAKKAGIALFSIAHFFETARLPLDALNYFDISFLPSEYSIELMLSLNRASSTERLHARARMASTSSPMFDQLQSIDKERARDSIGLPQDKPIVVFAAPVISPVTIWRWVVWRESDLRTRLKRAISSRRPDFLLAILNTPPFQECVNAVRAFCDRENATLIVKSRLKQDDPHYLISAADIYLDGTGEEYYPVFTTHNLLASADLVVSAQSMALVEAVIAGVPAVNIQTPQRELELLDDRHYGRYLNALLGGKRSSLLNFAGCIWSSGAKQFPEWFRSKRLEDFAVVRDQQEEYWRHFLDIQNTPSNERILNRIVSYVLASDLPVEA